MSSESAADSLQRAYYERQGAAYDARHDEAAHPEHRRALEQFAAMIERLSVASVLDVGAGTGRAVLFLRERFPALRILGVEPVAALRAAAVAKGVAPEAIVDGDGAALPFPDGAFDAVCAFGVLHHVRRPDTVVAEMCRVAGRGICISDSNFLGQGRPLARLAKRALFGAGLWPLANRIKTGGRGYRLSPGDGVSYSYSVYQSRRVFECAWRDVEWIATSGDLSREADPRTSAGHVCVLASGRRSAS